MAPVQAWTKYLAPGSQEAAQFEQLLRERIEQDYHAEDDLIRETLDSLRQSGDREQLRASLEEMFDDNDVMANWCCETLDRLVSEAEAAAAAAPPSSKTPSPPANKPQQAVASDEQGAQHNKRAPIRFALDLAAAETAPKKASDNKAQQLGVQKAAAAAAAPDASSKQKAPAAAAPAPLAAAAAAAADGPAQQQRQSRQPAAAVATNANSGSNNRQRAGAPAAPARLLRSVGLIRPTDGDTGAGSGSGSRSSRARTRQQQAQDGQQQQQQQAPPLQPAQQQQQQRKRAAEDTQGGAGRRVAPAAGGPSGPGSVFRNALGSLKPQERGGSRAGGPATEQQPPQQQQPLPSQQQQQQRAGANGTGGGGSGSSVFSRIDRNDLARLTAQSALPQSAQQQAQQQPPPPAQKQPQQQQQQRQQQQHGTIDALPQSLRSRLGIAAGRSSAAAGAAAGGQVLQSGRVAGTGAPTLSAAVGTKRQAGSDVAPAAAAAAAAATQQQGDAAAATKKTRTTTAAAAAPAAAAVGSKPSSSSGSMPSDVAAIKALIAAREAEVARLKQEQASQQQLKSRLEADQCSVVVFGPTQDLPEMVVRAHFSSCGGDIKRVTMWPRGRDAPAPPFAYVEFGSKADGSGCSAQQAASNAVALSGSTLVVDKITVVRKSDWQASMSKAQRGYAAARPAPGLPPATAGGNRTWKGPNAAAAAAIPRGTGVATQQPAAGATQT